VPESQKHGTRCWMVFVVAQRGAFQLLMENVQWETVITLGLWLWVPYYRPTGCKTPLSAAFVVAGFRPLCHLIRGFSPAVDIVWAMMIVWHERENYQNCSVLCCVWQLYTVIHTRTYEQFLKMRVGLGLVCVHLFRFSILCVFLV